MRKAKADRLITLKQAEEARREADAARVEQQRLAKLTAEASRKPTAVGAALPPEAQPPVTAKAVDDTPSDQVKLTRAVQTEPKRVGCDPGEVNGKWGNKSKDALRLFARVTKLTLPTDEPTEAMLWALKNREGRICRLNCEPDEREVNGKCVAKLPLNNFGLDQAWTSSAIGLWEATTGAVVAVDRPRRCIRHADSPHATLGPEITHSPRKGRATSQRQTLEP